MYEKILALLGTKFPQARKDGLQQLARALSLQASTETESQALVDSLESDKVTNFIKDFRKEVDSEISKGTKSFEENMKAKYDLVEKKNPNPNPSEETDDDIKSIVARAIAEAVTPLQEKINGFESGKTLASRKETLIKKLANAPEVYKNTVLKNFDKMNFESQDDFEAFVTEAEADSQVIEQALANKGLGSFPAPSYSSPQQKAKAIGSDIEQWAKKQQN